MTKKYKMAGDGAMVESTHFPALGIKAEGFVGHPSRARGAGGVLAELLNRNIDQPYKIVGIWLIDEWTKIGLRVTEHVVSAQIRTIATMGVKIDTTSPVTPVDDVIPNGQPTPRRCHALQRAA